MKRNEVLPGVHSVPGVRGGRAYLLVDKELALIDAGLPGSAKKVLAYIRKLGRGPQELRYIFITHMHPDHAGGAKALRRLTGAQVMAHRREVEKKEDGRLSFFLGRWRPRHQTIDRLLEGGESLPILGGLEVLHTPGHTPGSISVYLPERKVLFPGDLILRNGRRLSRPIPFVGFNGKDYAESLKRLAALDVEAICFAHGSPVVSGAGPALKLFASVAPRGPLWWRILRNAHTLAGFGLRMLLGGD